MWKADQTVSSDLSAGRVSGAGQYWSADRLCILAFRASHQQGYWHKPGDKLVQVINASVNNLFEDFVHKSLCSVFNSLIFSFAAEWPGRREEMLAEGMSSFPL